MSASRRIPRDLSRYHTASGSSLINVRFATCRCRVPLERAAVMLPMRLCPFCTTLCVCGRGIRPRQEREERALSAVEGTGFQCVDDTGETKKLGITAKIKIQNCGLR